MTTPSDVRKHVAKLAKLLRKAEEIAAPQPDPAAEVTDFADFAASVLEESRPPSEPELRLGLQAACHTDREKQSRFLRAYIKTGGKVQKAAELSGVRRQAHARWLRTDPLYRWACQTAQLTLTEIGRADARVATRIAESEAWRAALRGDARKRFTSKGEPIIDPETGKQYIEYTKDRRILLRLLEANCPEKYRNALQVIQQTGVQVQQVAGDVAAMAGSILPPTAAMEAAVRARIIQEQQQPGGNGNGNGKPKGEQQGG